jgi:YfiH family protein
MSPQRHAEGDCRGAQGVGGAAAADWGSALGARIAAAGWDWLQPDWPATMRIGGFASTRRGGCSAAPRDSLNLALHCGDDPAAVAENRRRIAPFLPSPPVWLSQVHGRDVAVLEPKDVAAARGSPPIADAAVTRVPGIVCAVLTADCLPVLFADRAGTAVGAAHAGWRGLAAGVLEATVAALGALGVPAARLTAWLGPAIGPRAFEVGDDVLAACCAGDPGAASAFVTRPDGKWLADLYALARRRLAATGVGEVRGGGWCTSSEHERFFSHRRQRDTGRQAAFVWRAPDGRADV